MNKLTTYPYDFDALYLLPFTRKRGLDPETLLLTWEPLVQVRRKTGVGLLDTVIDRLVENADPSTVAHEWGMTKRQLSTSLQVLTGLTLRQMVTRWKVRKVTDLLRYTALPLREVMPLVGFTSPEAFSRFVRKWTGLSPLHYRRSCRQPGDLDKYAL